MYKNKMSHKSPYLSAGKKTPNPQNLKAKTKPPKNPKPKKPQ